MSHRTPLIGHKAVRNDPDDGMCAVPDCGRKLEIDHNLPWASLKHKRGGVRGKSAPKPKPSEPSEPKVPATPAQFRVDPVLDRLLKLEATVREQKKLIGSLRNDQKQLLNRVQRLETDPKAPRISHRRIVDGGIHAKQQRNQPKLLKVG